ncbi:MAG: MOSC N-terminal beta barrel domain-containing protein [Bacteroidota bacterium]|nr:MOSC N-terminal beta barrel domain-containing protein [Bacteroidota bacterium]
MAYLESIHLHPIKSLDPVTVEETKILPGGALEHDREFALFGPDGTWIRGKNNPSVHLLRTTFNRTFNEITILAEGETHGKSFPLGDSCRELEAWLSGYFGFPVSVRRNTTNGFPDDAAAWGPTIVSTASLEEVSRWFHLPDADETRRRFRPNLVIGGTPPFWEDCLFDEKESVVRFSIGAAQLEGVNPCQRCVVPTRNPESGEAIGNFQNEFSTMREATLPSWAKRSRFNHFYRMCVNTRMQPAEAGKSIHVGDEVVLT